MLRIPSIILCCLFSLVCLGQDAGVNYITLDSAVHIAKNNGHYRTPTERRHEWRTSQPELDTAKGVWQVTSTRMKYRNWGRTTKKTESDVSWPCKAINGCHVFKTKTLLIDATTGRIVGRKKGTEVYGNFE